MTKLSLEREVLNGVDDLFAVRIAETKFIEQYANLLHLTMTSVNVGIAYQSGYFILLKTLKYDAALNQLPTMYQSVPVALMRMDMIGSSHYNNC